MPLIAAFLAALGASSVGLAVRVLLGIGLTVVVVNGVEVLLGDFETQIWANLGSTSQSILSIIVLSRVDDAIKVMLSTMVAILSMKVIGGAFRFTRWGAPPA